MGYTETHSKKMMIQRQTERCTDRETNMHGEIPQEGGINVVINRETFLNNSALP